MDITQSAMQSYGTGQVDERSIQGMLEDGDLFDFRPAAIIVQFQLLNLEDWNYEETASYGHFGHKRFPWEKTDKAEGLKQVFNKVKAA